MGTTAVTTTATRPLYEIAADIDTHWDKINYAAMPYWEAMRSLDQITDRYGYDSAASVVRYWLSNSSTWRGADARRMKAELRDMLGGR